jgi:hypothetical protein
MPCWIAALLIAVAPVGVVAQTPQSPALVSPVQVKLQRQKLALQRVDEEIARLRRLASAPEGPSEQDIRRLQALLEQKKVLEQQISDTMRSAYEAQQGPSDVKKPS